MVRRSHGVVDHVLKVQPNRRDMVFELENVLALAAALDAADPNVTVTRLELDPRGKPEPHEPVRHWSFDLRITVRSTGD